MKNNKKLTLALLSLGMVASAYSAPTISAVVTPSAPKAGDEVTVSINYKGAGSGAYGFGFNLSIDKSKVDASSAKVVCDEPYFGLTPTTCTNWTLDNQLNQIGGAYLPAHEVVDKDGFMKITFKVPSTAKEGDVVGITLSNPEFPDSVGNSKAITGVVTSTSFKVAKASTTTPTEPTEPTEPTTPVIPSATHPVPAVGLLGLFGMLASLAGAASLVLRRKK